MRGVLTLILFALALLFIALFFTAIFGLAIGETDIGASLMLMSCLGGLVAGSAILLGLNDNRSINRAQSLLALVLIWMVLPIFAAFPFFWLGGATYNIALFESVSGLTTTSATVFQVQSTPFTLLAWRSVLEWLGGYIVLASILFLLAPTGVGGLPQLRGFLFLEQDGKRFALEQFLTLLQRYIFVTTAVILLLLLFDTQPYLAVLAAFAGVSTGGYMPIESDLYTVMPKIGQLVLAIVLIYAATGLMWQRVSIKKFWQRLIKTREAIMLCGLLVVIALFYTRALNALDGSDTFLLIADHFFEGFFAAASLISTSGLETRFGIIQLLPEIFVLIIVLIGGSVASNAGGIKAYRVLAMITISYRELQRVIYPNAADAKNKRPTSWYAESSLNAVWTVLVSALVAILLGTFALAFTGLSFQAAFTAAISFFTNSGPIYTALAPPFGDDPLWLTYRDMPQLSYDIGIVLMILGRLEIIVFFASLNPKYWFQ